MNAHDVNAWLLYFPLTRHIFLYALSFVNFLFEKLVYPSPRRVFVGGSQAVSVDDKFWALILRLPQWLVPVSGLDWVGGYFSDAWSQIRAPSQITKILFRGVSLDKHLSALSLCTALQYLELRDMQVRDNLKVLATLTNLRYLDIHNIYNVGGPLGDWIAELRNLKSLTYQSCGATSLSPVVGCLTQLTQLDVSNNRLTELPDSIGNLSNLRWFNASNNKLAALPDTIGRLSSLRELQLPNNCLTSLPDNIGQLSSLQTLDCQRNGLITLPPSICALSNLKVLNVDQNLIAFLPTHIGQLTALSSLRLSKNRLRQLPASIVYLDKCLKWVTLSDNLVPDVFFDYQTLTFRVWKKRKHAWRRCVINAYRLALTLWRSRDNSVLSTLDVGGTASAVFALLCKADEALDFSDVCLERWQL